MKKLIFGLATFFTSVLGIFSLTAIDAFRRYLYYAYGDPTGLMGNASLYVFVITAAIGFVFALIGALSRDKNENKK